MKKKAIWIISIILFAVIAVFAVKKGKKVYDAQKLKVGLSGLKLKISNITDIISGLLSGFSSEITIRLKNFSNSVFTVNQISVDIYALNDVLIANQLIPLNQPINIQPNQNTDLVLSYNITPEGIINILKQVKDTGKNYKALLEDYLLTKTLGTQIKAKGFIVAEGFKVNIDELISI